MTAEDIVGANINKREQVRSKIDAFKLQTLMDREFRTLAPGDIVGDAISRMQKADLHEMPISEDGKRLLGVVSYGAILKRKNLSTNTKISTIMVIPPETTPETPITQVAESLISGSYRQLPVVEDNIIKGIVSRDHILGIIPKIKELRNTTVMDIMSTDVKTVTEMDKVEEAVTIMKNLDVRALPVIDDMNKVVGIAGIKDIVQYNWGEKRRQDVGELIGENRPVKINVESVMVEPAVTIQPNTTLGEAANLMLEKKISTLPVVVDGTIKGLVTKYDLVELIASFKMGSMVMLQITGLGTEEGYSVDVMQADIQKSLSKIAKIQTPMLFSMHIARYSQEGMNYKYSLSGRLITTDKTYVAYAVDWDLGRATQQLMKHFERQVIERKDEQMTHRKRTKNISHS